jgi:hypothetical protein
VQKSRVKPLIFQKSKKKILDEVGLMVGDGVEDF